MSNKVPKAKEWQVKLFTLLLLTIHYYRPVEATPSNAHIQFTITRPPQWEHKCIHRHHTVLIKHFLINTIQGMQYLTDLFYVYHHKYLFSSCFSHGLSLHNNNMDMPVGKVSKTTLERLENACIKFILNNYVH